MKSEIKDFRHVHIQEKPETNFEKRYKKCPLCRVGFKARHVKQPILKNGKVVWNGK